MKYSYVMMGNREIDLIRFFVLSKSIRDSGSDYNIIFLHFDDNFNPYNYRDTFNKLNLQLQFVNNPIDTKQIQHKEYLSHIENKEWDFIKLIPWTLTDYSKVLFMDADMLVLQNIDHLFDLEYDFVYTDGRISPLNSGIFLLKPNLTTFYGLQHFIYNTKFDIYNGWHNMGRATRHYAIEVCQGIFYYFFIKSGKFHTHYIPREIYNNMSPQCHKNTTEDAIKIVHFTSWQKPPQPPNKLTHPFQNKIHEKWTKNLVDLGLNLV